MKIIRNRILPIGRRYSAINLFGVVFVRRGMTVSRIMLDHEAIHTAQQKELLFVFFYLLYVVEWIIRLFQYRFNNYRAYRAISFEREAYAHACEPDYLSRRRHYAQWRKNTQLL